jgi:hypothetical protein
VVRVINRARLRRSWGARLRPVDNLSAVPAGRFMTVVRAGAGAHFARQDEMRLMTVIPDRDRDTLDGSAPNVGRARVARLALRTSFAGIATAATRATSSWPGSRAGGMPPAS